MAAKNTAGGEVQEAPVRNAGPTGAELTDRQLAEAVLARTLRPKTADIRRLAEAVLAKPAKKKAKDGAKKADGKKAKSPKADRKLAKIPGQKRKKA
jgi:hypothetical protein